MIKIDREWLFEALKEAIYAHEQSTGEIVSCRLLFGDIPRNKAYWWNGSKMILGRLDRIQDESK